MGEHAFAVVAGGGVLSGGDYHPTTVQILTGNNTTLLTGPSLPSGRDDLVRGVVSGKDYLLGGKSGTTTKPAVLIGTPS